MSVDFGEKLRRARRLKGISQQRNNEKGPREENSSRGLFYAGNQKISAWSTVRMPASFRAAAAFSPSSTRKIITAPLMRVARKA